MLAFGDITARLLELLGVTKERVEAVTGSPCGCDARRNWMNRVGFAMQRLLFRMLDRVAIRRNTAPFTARVKIAARHFRIGIRVLIG